jgi:L-fuculose-phosphate aldolase
MHFAIYETFPEAGAVIHAHPFYSMVFACTGTPIPVTAEYTYKLGGVPLTEPAPAHSQELADAVVKSLLAQKERGVKCRMAVLIPSHGVVCVGRDLDEAYDILERVETSARISLYSKLHRLENFGQ